MTMKEFLMCPVAHSFSSSCSTSEAIDVDVANEVAWVQAGATLGEVYYRIAEKSRAYGFPAGVCPTVGVGGHFSGGGYGNTMRKYGLSVDNIIDAKIVDVNGRLRDRKSMGEDLFWAITGGGGSSFGVVLAYKIKIVRVPEMVTVFRVQRTVDQNATDILEQWQQVAYNIDDDLYIRTEMDVPSLCSTIRSGGHDYEGVSYVSGSPFFLLDMFNLRAIDVDVANEVAWVQAGATLGEVYYRIAEKSRAYGFPAGVAPTVVLVVISVVEIVRVPESVVWQQVAYNIDDDLYIRTEMDVVSSTTRIGEKTVRTTFLALFLGGSKRLLSIMNASFPKLGLLRSDCIEMSWLESVLFWADFPLGTPADALLSRTPQSLTYLKIKSDYVQNPIPRDGLEGMWKKMVELQVPLLSFNPFGGKMWEIPSTHKPSHNRAEQIGMKMVKKQRIIT
uniref:FAD-binding PCMH-type domain-containing protein n=1 Tax=Salix viminalis TaxID=40686 RepID=A0A6N2K6D7_SALVM